MTTPFPFVAAQVLTAAQLNAITTLPIATKTANYVAVVGDVGKRIVMNMAGANTITINNTIFAEGDTIFLSNKGAGATTITAGAGVTINTSGSLVLAQYGGGTLVALSASTFTFFSGGGASYGTATGGTSASITVGGIGYTLLTFTSDDNLVVSKAGLFDYYMVGGGAGGGFGGNINMNSAGGGGGGAGGLAVGTIYLDATTYAVDIGAGGSGGDTTVAAVKAQAGFGSSIGTAANGIQIGGGGAGGGGGGSLQIPTVGANGGGAGGSTNAGGIVGANPSTPLGFAGGDYTQGGGLYGGGAGGGGHTAAGTNSTSSTGTAGGAGQSPSTFTGGNFATTIGVGGAGGNETGGGSGTAGGANTGNGGGGAQGSTTATSPVGSAGGSGRIFVRFKS